MTELFDENRESVVSETETDDLRTRIAAVLYGLWWAESAAHFPWEQLPAEDREPWLEDADAVIRELNLAKACQSGCMWQIPNHVEDMTEAQREMLNRTTDE